MKRITVFYETLEGGQRLHPVRVFNEAGTEFWPKGYDIPTEDQVISCHDEAGEIWLQVEKGDGLSVEEAIYLQRHADYGPDYSANGGPVSFWDNVPVDRVAYQHAEFFLSREDKKFWEAVRQRLEFDREFKKWLES